MNCHDSRLTTGHRPVGRWPVVSCALLLIASVAHAQPQVSFYNATPITLGSGFAGPSGVAVDASGSVYVADYGNNAVKAMPAACATGGACTVTTLGSGFSNPSGVAVDASGNVYVADYNNNAMKAMPAACTTGGACTVMTLGSGFNLPAGVAVDASGNVYVADFLNFAVKVMPATCATGGACPVTTLGSGFFGPDGVAVDASGNVYVADTYNNAVKVMPATCAIGGACTVTTLGSGFNQPRGVAVDASGNVYVADTNNSAVRVMPATCATGGACPVTTLGSGFNQPRGVTVDASGNVYVADYFNNAVKEITSAAPSLSFGSTAIGATRTQTVPITNISDQPLTLPALPAGFAFDASNTCTGTLAAGASCNLVIDFTPTAAGNVTGSYALTDTQVVRLLGAGLGPAAATPVPFDARWLPLLGMLLAGLGARVRCAGRGADSTAHHPDCGRLCRNPGGGCAALRVLLATLRP